MTDEQPDAIIDQWTASATQAALTVSHRRRCRALLRCFSRESSAPLLEAQAPDIEAWLSLRPLAPGTCRIYLSILGRFYEWARLAELRSDNPVTPIVNARLHRNIEAAQVASLLPIGNRPVPAEPVLERRCGLCGSTAVELRRVGREGPPVCSACYQRGRRDAEARARVDGAALRSHLVEAGLSSRTTRIYINYVLSAQHWFAEQGWQLATATGDQVAAYAATLPDTWATRKGLRSALLHYWQYTRHPRPPVRAIRVPPKPTMVCLAIEEDDARILAKAARAQGDLHGLAVVLGLYQAMRREEIAALPWDAFAEEGWMTIQGKNRKRRTIPVHPVVSAYLAKLQRPASFVFPGRVDGHVHPATIWEWIRELADEAGVGLVRPHQLRHTCLATQNDNTGDLRSVQHFAGHSNPMTTSGYTRATRRRLQDAVRAITY